MEKQFECPCFIDNELITNSLAVAYFDTQKDWQEFVYLNLDSQNLGSLITKIGNRYEANLFPLENLNSDLRRNLILLGFKKMDLFQLLQMLS